MKKVIASILTAALAMGTLTACGSLPESTDAPAAEAPAAEETGTLEEEISATEVSADENGNTLGTGVVGMSDLIGSEWNALLQEKYKSIFENAGYEVKIAVCDNDAARQVADIENLITAGCEYIYVNPSDEESIAGVMKEAREQGVKIFLQGSFSEDNFDSYDFAGGINMYDFGVKFADIAGEWVEETYPDEESVDVIIVEMRTNTNANLRCDGLETVSENSKINVVDIHDIGASTSPVADVQSYMEMAVSKYPDVKCYICFDSAFCMAIDEVLSQTGVDKSGICAIGGGSSELAIEHVAKSANDESVVRYLFDTENPAETSLRVWNMIKNGEELPEDKLVDIQTNLISAENAQDYLN